MWGNRVRTGWHVADARTNTQLSAERSNNNRYSNTGSTRPADVLGACVYSPSIGLAAACMHKHKQTSKLLLFAMLLCLLLNTPAGSGT